MAGTWEVVGGGDKGGILVRAGKETSSEQLPDRLATGAKLEEVELAGDRLHYKKLSGDGPDEGWVSLKAGGKLLVQREGGEAPAPKAAPKAGKTPRVLLLHGTASGQKIMEMQLGRLLKKFAGEIDFVILEGPKTCNPKDKFQAEAIETMSVYFKGKPMMMYDDLTMDDKNWRCYKKVQDTLSWLQAQMKKQGPFDGVLGFSQGANFGVMLAAQSYHGVGKPLSFFIGLCPNAPGYVGQLPELFTEPLPVPALIVRGEQEGYDEGIKKTLKGKTIDTQGEEVVSAHVLKLFKDPQSHTHPEGHRPMPSAPKEQDDMIDKIFDFIKEKAQEAPVVKPADGAPAAGA